MKKENKGLPNSSLVLRTVILRLSQATELGSKVLSLGGRVFPSLVSLGISFLGCQESGGWGGWCMSSGPLHGCDLCFYLLSPRVDCGIPWFSVCTSQLPRPSPGLFLSLGTKQPSPSLFIDSGSRKPVSSPPSKSKLEVWREEEETYTGTHV